MKREYHGKQHKDGHALWDAWCKAEDEGTTESMYGDWSQYPVNDHGVINAGPGWHGWFKNGVLIEV